MSGKQGSLLALIGGLLGLIAGLALGGLRAFGGPPPRLLQEAPGNAVFTLILISPYVIALVSARLDVRARAPLLLTAFLLSLASLGISLAGAGIVFLPAAVLLAMATVKSLRASGCRPPRNCHAREACPVLDTGAGIQEGWWFTILWIPSFG